MPISSQRPTLRDVARLAGVSAQTVSRVINNSSHVSPETRTRIYETMDALNYRPNKAAQILATRRSHMIEIITMDINYSGPFKRAVGDAARRSGYQTMFTEVTGDDFADAVRSAGARLVDGLVLIPSTLEIRSTDTMMLKLTHGLPFVQVATRLGAQVPSVIYHQEHGARLATQHLIDLGHREIAEICGPQQVLDAYLRHRSWAETLAENDLAAGPSLSAAFSPHGGYNVAVELLNRGARFTGLVAGNDLLALGALHALRERGLRVPQDVSVVGFDNIAEAAYFAPPLTTVYQNFELLGQMVIDYLISLIENPDAPRYQTVLTPELVVRQSTQSPQ